ncbi:MAG TPA: hypothetical protein PK801_06080 [Aggregatilineales bacterium]|nr:hypothetical protein [Aggregatilineales bacterium]HPV06826.1 hypothetical protein [Aggregatilineales bacterium]HQA67869.1 hypothetical protein [Aggregatilineales bacterium]
MATGTQAEPPGRLQRLRQFSARRMRRLLQIIYLPAVVLLVLWMLTFFAVATYRNAPQWVTDARSWAIGGRLGLTLWSLVGLQLVMAWLLGLVTAVGAAQAVSLGADLRRRFRVVRRRVRVYLAGLLLVRLVLLAVLLAGAVFVFTDWLGPAIDVTGAGQLGRTLNRRPVLPLLTGGLLLVQMLAGPFLRVRSSLALGLLAASFTPKRDERVWAALNARLGAGFASILGAVWSVAIAAFVLLLIYDPAYEIGMPRVYTYGPFNVIPNLFPGVPEYMAQVLTVMAAVSAAVAIHLTGQIVLPLFIRWIAMRRLRRQGAVAVSRGDQPV